MEADLTDENLDIVYRACGAVVIRWGLVEAMLNHIVTIVYEMAGEEHREPKHPNEFGRKLRFLRLCLKRVAELKPFAAEVAPLLTRAKLLGKTRDIIIHGSLSDYEPATGTILFVLFAKPKEGQKPKVENHRLTIDAIGAMATDAVDLGSDLARFTQRLLDEFVIVKERDNGAGTLAG